MRIFWIIVAVLALLAAFVVPFGDDAGEFTMGEPAFNTSVTMPPRDTNPGLDNDLATAENQQGSAETPVVPANQDSPSDTESSDNTTQAASPDPTPLDNDPADTTADTTAGPDDAVAAADEETEGDSDDGEDPKGPTPEQLVLEQEDGSKLIAGRYEIRGEGTKEEPYLIGWDYLISASQDYRPREGLDEIPPRIQLLHEKWVRITGYYIFPMYVSEVNESLVMQNQWDGCCIGVPPSVYDSIEVRLAEPQTLSRGHYALYGQYTGIMKIDPYLANNWLIGREER